MERGVSREASKKASKKPTGKKVTTSESVVTARVPMEIREQGNEVLKKIGATPTELINAAYKYVIDQGELPKAYPSLEEVAARRRTLTPEQKRKLKERAEEMTLRAPDSWEGKTFDQLREEAMRERYPEYYDEERG